MGQPLYYTNIIYLTFFDNVFVSFTNSPAGAVETASSLDKVSRICHFNTSKILGKEH